MEQNLPFAPPDPAKVESLRMLLFTMVLSLVDDVDRVDVFVKLISSDAIAMYARCAQSDIGKVIGKQGRTARSIRTVLMGASMKLRIRVELDISDPAVRPSSPAAPVAAHPYR